MRAALCLLAIALLAMPFAAADQTVTAGPVEVKTQSADNGDGCEGDNGDSMRYAGATVTLTSEEELQAYAAQYCSARNMSWGDGSWDRWEGESGMIFVGRVSDGNAGPMAYVFYSDFRQENSWGYGSHFCGSGVYASGPVLFTGCYPDGGRWPMLPTLP